MKTTSTLAATQAQIHPLFSREVRPIRNWFEWLERWKEAVTLEEMTGLLHTGFDVQLDDADDRIIFYFAAADGWNSWLNFQVPGGKDDDKKYQFGWDRHGNSVWKNQAEVRQMVAEKAFDMLCTYFFKFKRTDEGHLIDKAWKTKIVTDRLLSVIINFFSVRKDSIGGGVLICNMYHGSRNHEVVKDFLLSLANFLWEWKEEPIRSWDSDKNTVVEENMKMQARIKMARLWMIEVLSFLKAFEILVPKVLKLNKQCLAKLREIAMRRELDPSYHPVRTKRQVRTIEEAYYAGSSAAQLLKRHELFKSEHARLSDIYQLEGEKNRAESRIRELAPAT